MKVRRDLEGRETCSATDNNASDDLLTKGLNEYQLDGTDITICGHPKLMPMYVVQEMSSGIEHPIPSC